MVVLRPPAILLLVMAFMSQADGDECSGGVCGDSSTGVEEVPIADFRVLQRQARSRGVEAVEAVVRRNKPLVRMTIGHEVLV